MKFILILILSTMSIFATNIDKYAQEMGFERDYKTAITFAKKEKKLLVMVLSADYCPWCRKFERKTLNSKQINPKLKNEVVTLVVDNKYDATTFPEKYQTNYTPMVHFINPDDENIIKSTIGYKKKKDFLATFESVQKTYKESK